MIMNSPVKLAITLFVFSTSIFSAWAAGPLTPPGAPSPSMKTLQEIEPRIPITNLPVTISVQGASYYLTGSLTGSPGNDGITISADGITLDLNGFALIGGASSKDGVVISSGIDGVTIRNGTISEWGDDAIEGSAGAFPNESQYHVVEKIHAIDNVDNGIVLGKGSRVSDCSTVNNGGCWNYCSERKYRGAVHD